MTMGSAISKRVKAEEEVNGEDENSLAEQEEALVALIEHRTREVELLRQRISYYESQLDQAEKRLQDSQTNLARLRALNKAISSNVSLETKSVKVERRSTSPEHKNGGSKNQPQSRTELVIPSVNPKIPQPTEPAGSSAKTIVGLEVTAAFKSALKVKAEKSLRSSIDVEAVEIKDRGTKRKSEQIEHEEVIPLVRSSSSPTTISSYTSNYIPSQHKRRLRCLAVCPANDQIFMTSALDGLVNLWKIQARGYGGRWLISKVKF